MSFNFFNYNYSKDYNQNGNQTLSSFMKRPPAAWASVRGSEKYPAIKGTVRFYQMQKGVLVVAEVNGLPKSDSPCQSPVFAFHIHDGASCDNNQLPNGNTQNPNGNMQNPNGSMQNPNGSMQNPNGNTQNPNGNTQNPNGNMQNPNGNTQNPNGNIQNPNGNTQNPNGNTQNPNGNTQNPNGNTQNPNGNMQNPNGNMQNPNGNMQNPNGSMQNPNGNTPPQNNITSPPDDTLQNGIKPPQNGNMTPEVSEPFPMAGTHYNPNNCRHPYHAGDMPPLFGANGYAFLTFVTSRFTVKEIIGKTVIIHSMPDDFATDPSGNSGEKIACGVIVSR